MEQRRTKLTNFVKRIEEKAYEEGFKKGFSKGMNTKMNTKQWDKDIAKTIPEGKKHKTLSEILEETEK